LHSIKNNASIIIIYIYLVSDLDVHLLVPEDIMVA